MPSSTFMSRKSTNVNVFGMLIFVRKLSYMLKIKGFALLSQSRKKTSQIFFLVSPVEISCNYIV